MAEVVRTKPTNRPCRHLYPARIALGNEHQRRARCLGCGELGPPRTNLAEALRALRASFVESERLTKV